MIKKLLSIILSAAPVLSAAACAPKASAAPAETTAAAPAATEAATPAETAAAVTEPAAPEKNVAVILYTNDTHSFINNKVKTAFSVCSLSFPRQFSPTYPATSMTRSTENWHCSRSTCTPQTKENALLLWASPHRKR